MSSRLDKEKDRTKQIQDKCQTILEQLLKDEDNKYCVDCDAKGPRWASWNLGIFLCIRCAGIHRNLGVHISKVKSVNLDSWTPEQVVTLQQMGNSRARAVYEANLPDAFRRPQTDSALEAFIRAKYEHRKYVAREWVPPSPPQVNWDKEIDEEMEKQKKKKKSSSSGAASLSNTSIPSPAEKKASVSKKSTEVPQPLPKPKSSVSPKPGRATPKRDTTGTADLLVNTASPASDTKSQPTQVEDVFSSFLSAPQSSTNVDQKAADLKSEEENFFNQPAPSEKEKSKMTKDSILALYGQGNKSNQSFIPPSNAPFTATFPSQMVSQTQQFPQTQNNFAQGFAGFPVQNTSFPAANGAMHQQQPNLSSLGGQNANFGNFSQFSNAVQPQQQQQGTFNQFPMQQNQFQQHNSSFMPQQQNAFSSMPAQFPQQSQFPNMNGFPATNNVQNSLNGQQFFNMQPTTNTLQQQFGNMTLGSANSFSGPQSLSGVYPAKTQTSNMAANSVWQ